MKVFTLHIKGEGKCHPWIIDLSFPTAIVIPDLIGNPDFTLSSICYIILLNMGKITVVSISPFAGKKNLIFCEGKGPDNPNCLYKNPPPGKEMISGHVCGGGCEKFGSCQAVFANREEHPDLFKEPL